MPVRYDFSDVKFWTMDGTPIEIGNFTDITIEPGPGVEVGLTYANTPIAYGWKARGPIRKRVIQRLWKQHGIMGEAR